MNDATAIRVLIADDHSILRDGLRLLIDAEPGLTLVGEARDGVEAWRQTCESRPDVVVLDLSLPVLSGLEALKRITSDCPDTKVLILTGHDEPGHMRAVLGAGAAGYLLKRATWPEIARAIRSVAAGQRYVDPSLAGTMLEDREAVARRRRRGEAKDNGKAAALTARESEVLHLLARGYGNKEIAASLSISVKTVETHRASGMSRLGVRSRAALVQYGLVEGWLRDDY
jgi:DNA-binding NarL/FixJ family response regulator